MDLSLIKQKLSASQNKGQKREKVDYSKIFFKPKPGKYQVRILPSKFDKFWPYQIGTRKILSLNSQKTYANLLTKKIGN